MDEDQLVQGLRSQDPGAVQESLVAYGDRLFRSACMLCGNEAEAQDLVQETFLQAVRSAHRFGGRAGVYTWLHGILLNLTRHYHRDRKRLVYDDELAHAEPAPPDETPNGLDVEMTEQLRKMAAYEYNGCISTSTHSAFNMVPYRVFLSQVSGRISHRTGLRCQIFFDKLTARE